MDKFDIAVVGSGAGLIVMERAIQKGLRVALVEREKFGGTCLTKGCIPTKMLVYPADVIREAARAAKVDLYYDAPRMDWNGLSDRIWAQIGQHKEIEQNLDGISELTVYKGSGAFTGPHTMKVRLNGGGEQEFEAERFVIAAGAQSAVPHVDGLEQAGYVTYESFFGDKYPKKPWESLIIVGCGAVGAEFAHIFSAFGTRVTLVEAKDRLLTAEDEEISAFVRKQFESAGIRVLTNTRIVSVQAAGGRKTAVTQDAATGVKTTLDAQEIFIAAGSRPATVGLDIAKAGIETDAAGWIATDEYMQTSQPHIYALGDINGKYQFRHKANYEAGIVSHNLFDAPQKQKAADYTTVPWAVFTLPQTAHVGMTQREAAAAGMRLMVGRNRYSEIAGGIAMGYAAGDADDGFFKLIVDEHMKIVGVHAAGPNAPLLLQPFVYLMNAGFTCSLETIEKKNPGKYADRFKNLRTMCPQAGTYMPISNSMAIHPSLNELAAWVVGKLEWVLPEETAKADETFWTE